MTAYRDLERIDLFEGPGFLAVGWLERDTSFPTGLTPASVFQRLEVLLADPFQPVVSAGKHACTLCQFKSERSGSINLFVPGNGVIYVCPELVLHYINAHHYAPPTEFCDAVLQCPIPDQSSTS